MAGIIGATQEIDQDDYNRRMVQFSLKLTPEQRLGSSIDGFCVTGAILFKIFCKNPPMGRDFMRHILSLGMKASPRCSRCWHAFIKHLYKVTD